MGKHGGQPAWPSLDAMSQKELDDRRARVGFSLKVDKCDYCLTGNHGRCYGVICRCTHESWERDPNAQVPHGLAAGQSKETKIYNEDGHRYAKTNKRGGMPKRKSNQNYRLPGA